MAIVPVGGPGTGEVAWPDLLEKPYDEIVKPSNETVTSSATMQDDNDLTIALAAGKYAVELFLAVSAHASGGLKYTWGAITGSTAYRRSALHTLVQVFNTGLSQETGQTSAVASVKEEMILVLTQAGTLTLRWAQNSSFGTGTAVVAGSYMRVWRLDS